MNKRGLIISICMIIVLCLSACGDKKEKEKETESVSKVVATQAPTESVKETETQTGTDKETESVTEESTQPDTEKSTKIPVQADAYDGAYADSRDPNTTIEVITKDDVTTVKISMAVSITQTYEWTFSGKFDEEGTLKYTDGVKNTVSYTDETSSTAIEEYKNGKGSVTVIDDVFTWNDEEEGIALEGAYKKL